MPDLHLMISNRVRASVTQPIWGREARVTLEWYEDGVLSEIHSELIDDARNVWDTLHVGTTWYLPVVERLIGDVMPKAFDKYWRASLKGMGKHEIIALATYDVIDRHFTLNPNGGMDSWLVKDGHAYWAMYYQTIDDIIAGMWRICPKIDGWVKVSKGDIYPSLEDAEDTQELERVGDNDDTVPGVVIDDSPMAEFIANVKAKLLDAKSKPMCGVSSVASSNELNWEWYEIWCEGDGWRVYRSEKSKATRLDSRHQQALYLNIEAVINRMWELVPRPHYWQVFGPVGGHDE